MRIRIGIFILVSSIVVAGQALAAGPWRASERNTRGWSLMTPKERLEHQAAVRAFTDYDACHAYQLRHHEEMEARARAAGRPLRGGRHDICEHLRPVSR